MNKLKTDTPLFRIITVTEFELIDHLDEWNLDAVFKKQKLHNTRDWYIYI